ncbi:MAG: hypothetical protein LiPW39_370 [Parcubacteria group bacterium LiPW_39]|nr:MAG: hypothetical protein LiPW39_370 [Parcubacteria group bacterium LiPW_39]
MISHARQIFDAAAANNHNRVFLQIMAFARNISRHFHAVGQTNAADFTQSRIGLFGSGGGNFQTNASFKRRGNFLKY